MKKSAKKLTLSAALAAVGAMGFSACSNYAEAVYGPPPDVPEEPASSVSGSSVTDPVDDPENFDPADNEIEDVYGPPVEDFPEEDPDEEIDDYPVDENMIETVYGPPEDFEEQVVPAEDGE